jgi:hypothetical protein
MDFEASWGFGIEEMISDGNHIEPSFTINFNNFFYRDIPITKCGVNMEIAQ